MGSFDYLLGSLRGEQIEASATELVLATIACRRAYRGGRVLLRMRGETWFARLVDRNWKPVGPSGRGETLTAACRRLRAVVE